MSLGREIPADEWEDETRCPNCRSRQVVEFGYKIGGSGRTCLECRDCGAYSTWRVAHTAEPTGDVPGRSGQRQVTSRPDDPLPPPPQVPDR